MGLKGIIKLKCSIFVISKWEKFKKNIKYGNNTESFTDDT